MRKALLLLFTCLVLLAGAMVYTVWQWWEAPLEPPGGILQVDSGSSLSVVARKLADSGALRWPRLWVTIARLRGEDSRIRRGEYLLDVSRSPAQLLDMLVSGRVVQYSVTLPEGITLAEALEILQDQKPVKLMLDGWRDPRLLESIKPYTEPEGLFFPDTYVYTRGQTDLEILTQAHRRMVGVLDAAWGERDVGLPYQDAYEALVMASIVEKETGAPDERERIAGVFVRRLQQNMRLQTDPTVIYGLGEAYTGNLRRRHLSDTGNPFNTYRHKGLPPTPIALPGRAAVLAAVHPAPGAELYFVARGDGSHQFSTTIEEHTLAVRRYQLQRRKDYRSSPPPPPAQPETGEGQ
jgi:UPF0755 protein